MSFERLPLALALSVTLLGGSFFFNGGSTFAAPMMEGQTASCSYDRDGSTMLLIADRDSDDDTDDRSAKDKKGSAKDKIDSAKDKKDIAKDKKDSAKDKKDIAKDKKDAAKNKKGADKDKIDTAQEEKSPSKKFKSASSKEEKIGKDKKALKAEKAEEKAAAKASAEEDGEKKKGKSIFFYKRNVAEEKTQAESRKAKTTSKKEAADEEKSPRSKSEAKVPPVFIPDNALISVLKDINRALADTQTEQVQKIENANEIMILGLAQEIFTKALADPNLAANRIVPKDQEYQARTFLTAESWSSGDVVVGNNLRGSMAAVWAKRIGGLLTVTIAGDAGQRKSPDGTAIGEFMVVITAHSPVQSGFDIQSQGDVTFWMGKLNNIAVEANCVPSADTASNSDKPEASSTPGAKTASPRPAGEGEAKKKSIVSLSPLLTNRYRKHYEILLAADQESKRVAAQPPPASSPDNKAQALAGDESKAKPAPDRAAIAEEKDSTAKDVSGQQSIGSMGDATRAGANNGANNQIALAADGNKTAEANGTNTAGTVSIVESVPQFRMPSASSTLLMPERALAGQYVTVALLDRERLPEANVQLSFNGASLCTDSSGQAVYQIPDDTTPGRSLNIALSARPDEVPATLEVLQPLNVTTGLPPRLDRMTPLAIKNSIVTVDGHNFDGLAHNDCVIVDGALEGHIVSASPYQLKLLLPQDLRPGPHSLCVSTDGMRSNLGGFDYADTLVTVDGKDSGKENSNIKLLVKVIGTTAKMNVKILNQTPDIIRLNRGAEMTITSSGGFDNTIQLPAVRAKKGAFSIATQIEI